VANVTFIFGTSPNTKPEEKKWGDMAYYIPPTFKSEGDTFPVFPTKLRPWLWLFAFSKVRHGRCKWSCDENDTQKDNC